MARKVIVHAGPKRRKRPYGWFAEVETLAENLQPDDAFLIGPEGLNPNAEAAHEQIINLRTTARKRLKHLPLAFLPDFKNGGVWVHRPAYGGLRSHQAIGPAKEHEIRTRPLEEPPPEQSPILRPSARLLVIDPDKRLLLFKAIVSPDVGELWLTPGGRLEEGETFEAGALRKLREQTGMSGVSLGPCVWTRTHVFRRSGVTYKQVERYFAVRTESRDVSHNNWTASERETLVEHCWWTQREMQRTQAVLVPRGLFSLLGPILAGDYPSEPLAIGV